MADTVILGLQIDIKGREQIDGFLTALQNLAKVDATVAISNLDKVFDSFFDSLFANIPKMASLFSSAFTFDKSKIDVSGIALLNLELTELFKNITTLSGAFSGNLAQQINTLTQGMLSLGQAAHGLGKLNIATVTTNFTQFLDLLKKFGTSKVTLSPQVSGNIQGFATAITSFGIALKKLSSGQLTGVPALLDLIVEALKKLGKIDLSGLSNNLPAFAQGLEELVKALQSVGRSAKTLNLLPTLIPVVTSAIDELIKTLVSASNQLNQNNNLITNLPILASGIKALGEAFRTFGGTTLNNLPNNLAAVTKGLEDFSRIFNQGQFQQNLFGNNNISQSLQQFAAGLKNLASAFSKISNLKNASVLGQNIDEIVKSIGKLNIDAFNQLAKRLKIVTEPLKDFIEVIKLLNRDSQKFSIISNNVAQLYDALRPGVVRNAANAFLILTRTLVEFGRITGLNNVIKSLLVFTGNSIVSGVKKLANGFVELSKSIGNNVINGLIKGFTLFFDLLIKSPINFFINALNKLISALFLLVKPITSVVSSLSSLFNIFKKFGNNKKIDLIDENDIRDSDKLQSEFQQTTQIIQQTTQASQGLTVNLSQINNNSPKGLIGVFRQAASEAVVLNNVLNTAHSIVQRLVGGFSNLTSQGLETISFNERLRASITALSAVELVNTGQFKNVDQAYFVAIAQADKYLAKIKQLAIISPFSKDDIASGFKLAQAFGFVSEEAFNLTRIITNFATATGQSGSQIAEIITVFGQIRQAGKLQAQDLKQLTDRQIPVLQLLADAYGQTTSEIKESIQEGAIGANDAINILAKNLDQSFSSIAKKQANTFSAIFSSLGDIKNENLSAFFTPILDAVKPFLAGLTALLQSPDIINGLTNLGKIIGDNLTKAMLILGKAIGFVLGIFAIMPKPLKDLLKNFVAFATITTTITLIVGSLYAAFVTLVPILALVFNGFSLITGAIISLTTIIITNSKTISTYVSTLINSFSGFNKVVNDSTNSLQSNINNVTFNPILQQLQNVQSAFINVADRIGKGFTTGKQSTGFQTGAKNANLKTETGANDRTPFPETSNGTVERLKEVRKEAAGLKGFLLGIFNSIEPTLAKAAKGISILLTLSGAAIKGLGVGLQNISSYDKVFSKVFDTGFVTGGMSELEQSINGVFRAVKNLIEGFFGLNNSLPLKSINILISYVNRTYQSFIELNSFTAILGNTLNYLGGILKVIISTLGGLIASAGQFAIDLGLIIDKFIDAGIAFLTFDGKVKNTSFVFKQFFDEVEKATTRFLKSIVNNFFDGFLNIGKLSNEFGNNLTKNFNTILQNAVDFGKGFINVFASAISSGLGAVKNAIASVGSLIAYYMQPNSPPRFLPDIDDWGRDTADVYLQGFNEADFKNISGFANTLEDLLTSLNFDTDDIDTKSAIKAIVEQFSAGLDEIGSSGEVSKEVLESIGLFAGDADKEVINLVNSYFKLAKQTDDLEDSTAKYEKKLNETEKALDSLNEASKFKDESKQIELLNAQLQNKYLNEEQRQEILGEISRINHERELRAFKKEKDAKEKTVKATENEIDALEERIDLANQFQDISDDDELTIRNPRDRRPKTPKPKKKKKGDEETAILKPLVDASDALKDIGAVTDDLKDQLDGLGTDAFSQFKDNILSSQTAVQGWGDILTDKVSEVKSAFQSGIQTIKDNFFNTLNSMLKFSQNIITQILGFFNIKFELPKTEGQDFGFLKQFEAPKTALENLMQTFKDFKTIFSTLVLPDWLQQIVDYFKDAENQAYLLAGAIGIIISGVVLANLSTFIGLLAGIAPLVAGVAALGLAFTGIYNLINNLNLGNISKFFSELSLGFSNGKDSAENFQDFLSNLFNGTFDITALQGIFANILGAISGFFENIETNYAFDIATLFTFDPNLSLIDNLKLKFNELLDFIKNLNVKDVLLGLLNTIKDFLINGFLGLLDSISNSLGVKISATFGVLFGQFKDNLANSGLAQEFQKFIQLILPVLKVVGGAIAIFIANIIGLIPEIPKILTAVLQIINPILKVINDAIDIVTALFQGRFSDAVTGLGTLFSDIFFGIGDIIGATLDLFDSLGQGLINVLNAIKVGFGLEDIIDPIIEQFGFFIEILGGLLTGGVLKFLGGFFAALFKILAKGSGIVKKFVLSLKVLTPAFQALGNFLFDFIKFIGNSIGGLFSAKAIKIYTFGLNKLFSLTVKLLSPILPFLNTLFGGIISRIGSFIPTIGKFLSVLGSALTIFGTFIANIFKLTFSVMRILADNIFKAIQFIKNGLNSLFSNKISQVAITIFKGIGNFIIDNFTNVILILVPIIQKFGLSISSIKGFIDNVITSVVNFFKYLFSGFTDTQNQVDQVTQELSFFGSIWDWIKEKAQDFVFAFVDFMASILTSIHFVTGANGLASIGMISFDLPFSLTDLLYNLVTAIPNAIVGITGYFITLINDMTGLHLPNPFQAIYDFIFGEDGFLSLFGDIIAEIQTFIANPSWATIPNPFDNIYNFIKDTLTGAITGIWDTFSTLVTDLTGIVLPNPVTAIYDYITNTLTGGIDGVFDTFNNLVTNLGTIVFSNPFKTIYDYVTNTFLPQISGTTDSFNTLVENWTGIKLPNPFDAIMKVIDTLEVSLSTDGGIIGLIQGLNGTLNEITLSDVFKPVSDGLAILQSYFPEDSLIAKGLQAIIDILNTTTLKDIFSPIYTTLGAIAGLFNGDTALDTKFGAFLQKILDTTLADIFKPISDGLQYIANFLPEGSGLKKSIEDLINLLNTTSLSDIFKPISDGLAAIALFFFGSGEGSNIKDTIIGFATAIGAIVIAPFLAPVIAAFTTLTNYFLGENAIGSLFTTFKDLVNGITFVDIFATLIKGFNTVYDFLFGEKSIGQLFTDLKNTLANLELPNPFAGLSEQFSGISDQFDSFLVTIGVKSEVDVTEANLTEDSQQTIIDDVEGQIPVVLPTTGATVYITADAAVTEETKTNVLQAGKDTYTGYNDGIIAASQEQGNVLEEESQSWWGGFLTSWGINSPSKKAEDEGGRPIVEGLFKGITNTFKGFKKVVTNITNEFKKLFDALLKLTNKFAEDFEQIFTDLAKTVTDITTGLMTNLNTEFDRLTNEVFPKVSNFISNTSTELGKLSDIFKTAAGNAISALKTELDNFDGAVIGVINEELKNIVAVYDDKEGANYKAGLTIGQWLTLGIKDGIKSVLQDVKDAVEDLINETIAQAKETLQSESPSKKTRDLIGRPYGQGIALGILNEVENVEKSVAKLFEPLMDKQTIELSTRFNLKFNDKNISNLTNSLDFNKLLVMDEFPKTNSVISNTAFNRSSVINNTNKPEYHLHVSVQENQLTNVRRNFKVAEFIGI